MMGLVLAHSLRSVQDMSVATLILLEIEHPRFQYSV
jgi:hypothetical protein